VHEGTRRRFPGGTTRRCSYIAPQCYVLAGQLLQGIARLAVSKKGLPPGPVVRIVVSSGRLLLWQAWYLARASDESLHIYFLQFQRERNLSVTTLCLFPLSKGLFVGAILKQKLQNCEPIDLRRFVVELRERHLEYWTPYSETHPREYHGKHSTYHRWCALPEKRALVTHSPYILPRLHFNLPRDDIRITARLRLRVHTLHFEAATWSQSNTPPVTCVMLMIFKMSSISFSTASFPA